MMNLENTTNDIVSHYDRVYASRLIDHPVLYTLVS